MVFIVYVGKTNRALVTFVRSQWRHGGGEKNKISVSSIAGMKFLSRGGRDRSELGAREVLMHVLWFHRDIILSHVCSLACYC